MGTNEDFSANVTKMKAVMPVRQKRNVESTGEDRNKYWSLMGKRRGKWPCLWTRKMWKHAKMDNNSRDSTFK
jgi:hypothetical protein